MLSRCPVKACTLPCPHCSISRLHGKAYLYLMLTMAIGYGCPAPSMPHRPMQRKTKNANFLALTHDLHFKFCAYKIIGALYSYPENLEPIAPPVPELKANKHTDIQTYTEIALYIGIDVFLDVVSIIL